MKASRANRRKELVSGKEHGRGKAQNPGALTAQQASDRVHGVIPVVEALRAGRRTIEHISIAEGSRHERLRELLELAKAARVPVRKIPRVDLERALGSATHQGVVAKIAAARYADADDLLDAL